MYFIVDIFFQPALSVFIEERNERRGREVKLRERKGKWVGWWIDGGGKILRGGKEEAYLVGKGKVQGLTDNLGQVPKKFKIGWISFKLWTCANFHDFLL